MRPRTKFLACFSEENFVPLSCRSRGCVRQSGLYQILRGRNVQSLEHPMRVKTCYFVSKPERLQVDWCQKLRPTEFSEIKQNTQPLRRSRSFNVTDFCTNRKPICDGLLVINTNIRPILHRFQVMADYWSNCTDREQFILTPLLRVIPCEYPQKLHLPRNQNDCPT